MAYFDTLSYAKSLRESGISAKQAEAMAEALPRLLTDNVATKADIAELRAYIDVRFARQEATNRILLWIVGVVLALSAAESSFLAAVLQKLLA